MAIRITRRRLLEAGAGLAYVGPIFALVGFGLKQWSAYAQVPAQAWIVLRSCRNLLSDIHMAWPRLSENPEAKLRAERTVSDIAKVVQESIDARTSSLAKRWVKHPVDMMVL